MFSAKEDEGMQLRRAGLTFKEREILALERISDQLAFLAQSLGMVPNAQIAKSGVPEAKDEASGTGALDTVNGAESPADGIERVDATSYLVGKYRYTDLNHAMAELRRQKTGDAPVERSLQP
jgi:hypothetical protein